jgi:hypothetical protein
MLLSNEREGQNDQSKENVNSDCLSVSTRRFDLPGNTGSGGKDARPEKLLFHGDKI